MIRGGAILAQQTTTMAATSVTYPGTPGNVQAARRFVRGIVVGSPRADDIELIAAELITNAILHTPSGREGGTFTVTIRQGPGRARLEVADQGKARWHPPSRCNGSAAEYGRGLAIVAALADTTGQYEIAGAMQGMWAEVTW